MKKIFNSIKSKGSKEQLNEKRRSRLSQDYRRSTDEQRDHNDATAAARSATATAPSHPALNLKGSGTFVDAEEFPENHPHHSTATNLGGDSSLMTEPHSKSRTPHTAVTTTTETTVETGGAVQPVGHHTSIPGSTRNVDQTPAINKPLPPVTNNGATTLPASLSSTPIASGTTKPNKVLDPNVRLPEGFNINDSEHIDKKVTYAKPVVQETVKPLRHNIVHEHIIREIHNHDVYHRILPIIDVEVLPAKHYIQDPKNPLKLIEVAEHEVPGYRGPGKHNWQIVETVSKLDSAPRSEKVGSRFSARSFAPGESATREWVDGEGVQRSERTWVHPPVSTRTEGTVPLYMGHWPEHEVSATGSTNPGWPGMPGHTGHAENGTTKNNTTSPVKNVMLSATGDNVSAYRPTTGARSASTRSDLQTADHQQSLEGSHLHSTHNHSKDGEMNALNNGVSGLKV